MRRPRAADPGSGSDRAPPAPHPRRGIVGRPARNHLGPDHAIASRARAGCAILATAGVIPFLLKSPAKFPSQGNSRVRRNPRVRVIPLVRRTPRVTAASPLVSRPPGQRQHIVALLQPFWRNPGNSRYLHLPVEYRRHWLHHRPRQHRKFGHVQPRWQDPGRWRCNRSHRPMEYCHQEANPATLVDPASKGVESVAFSPDGKILAAGDFDGRVYLWNVASGGPTATLADPGSKGVGSVAFSPDGNILAAGDFNGRVYLWNAASGRLVATLADPDSDGVDSVAFSPDGQALAVGDENGNTYLWNVAHRINWPLTFPASAGGALTRSRSAPMARPWPRATGTAARTCGMSSPANWPLPSLTPAAWRELCGVQPRWQDSGDWR